MWVYTSCFSPKVKIAPSTMVCVCVGLGPYPFMLNTPPRARRPLRFQDSQETKGERVGQPIKKCAYTRLLISRRPFKVGGGGARRRNLWSAAAADCQWGEFNGNSALRETFTVGNGSNRFFLSGDRRVVVTYPKRPRRPRRHSLDYRQGRRRLNDVCKYTKYWSIVPHFCRPKVEPIRQVEPFTMQIYYARDQCFPFELMNSFEARWSRCYTPLVRHSEVSLISLCHLTVCHIRLIIEISGYWINSVISYLKRS